MDKNPITQLTKSIRSTLIIRYKSLKLADIRQTIYDNIQANNKVLSKEHLDTLGWEQLLRNTHPLDRERFAIELERRGLISPILMEQFTNKIQKSLIQLKKAQ